jgi:hypothetical protein
MIQNFRHSIARDLGAGESADALLFAVSNANNAAKGQRPVGGGQPLGVETLAARSSSPLQSFPVPRCQASLHKMWPLFLPSRPIVSLFIRAPAAASHQSDGDHQGNDRQVREHVLFGMFFVPIAPAAETVQSTAPASRRNGARARARLGTVLKWESRGCQSAWLTLEVLPC